MEVLASNIFDIGGGNIFSDGFELSILDENVDAFPVVGRIRFNYFGLLYQQVHLSNVIYQGQSRNLSNNVSIARKTNAKIIQSFHNLVPSPNAARLPVFSEFPDDRMEKLLSDACSTLISNSFML